MYTLLIVLIVLAALLMCFIVLIQNSKGGGLAAGFASSNQIMGVRKTTDVIEKTTWGLAIAMVVFSVLTAYTLPSAKAESSVIMQEATKDAATNPLNAPAGFAAPTTEADAPATSETPTGEIPGTGN
ncbi:MAG: preprotein translocase subunit SecG [Bacteroidales bacterium]|nr:preprotein translocase subunit SecG [Bacteroidales bacterium]